MMRAVVQPTESGETVALRLVPASATDAAGGTQPVGSLLILQPPGNHGSCRPLAVTA